MEKRSRLSQMRSSGARRAQGERETEGRWTRKAGIGPRGQGAHESSSGDHTDREQGGFVC